MALETPLEFGKGLKDLFYFDPEWRNMNNGSFGSVPRVIKEKQIALQLRCESVPDLYTRYEFPVLLDEARAALAKHLNAPVETIVMVANATTAFNVVLQNLVWNPDGNDEIVSFSTIYGGCGKTVDAITDANPLVTQRVIQVAYPADDDAAIVSRFRSAVAAARAEGKTPRVAVFDTVTSLPGVRFPFEAVAAACRELGVLSLVDGAQGVGMVPLDLAALDADFALSNCHKWLHTPRGCAFLYVPVRNQHLIRTTLPTSHGYEPRAAHAAGRFNPLPPRPADRSAFVENFQFVGTVDNTSFLVVKDALEWRERVLGGEARILAYLWRLAKEGGRRAAAVLGTEVIDNAAGTLTDCAMVNFWLPVRTGDDDASAPDGEVVISQTDTPLAIAWANKTLVYEHKTFIPIAVHTGRWYARLSAQVYLDEEDFEWAAHRLKEVCERIGRGEHK